MKILIEERITEPVGAGKGLVRPVVWEDVDGEGNPVLVAAIYMNPPSSRAWAAEAGRDEVLVSAFKTQQEREDWIASKLTKVDETIRAFPARKKYDRYETAAKPPDGAYAGTYEVKP